MRDQHAIQLFFFLLLRKSYLDDKFDEFALRVVDVLAKLIAEGLLLLNLLRTQLLYKAKRYSDEQTKKKKLNIKAIVVVEPSL